MPFPTTDAASPAPSPPAPQSIKLVPLLSAGESGPVRPVVSLARNQSICLGRNVVTRINNSEVSRHVATVEWNDRGPLLRLNKVTAVVKLNDLMMGPEPEPLPHGATFSLHGDEYSYRVEHEGVTSTTTTAAAAAAGETAVASASSGAEGIAEPAQQEQYDSELLEESSCPICMEILVDSTAVSSCGHTFCRACLTGKECPVCRQSARQPIPIRRLDNMIWRLVLQRRFAPDEVSSYLQRSGRVLTDSEVSPKESVGANCAPIHPSIY